MYNFPVADGSLVSCRHCDLLQRLPALSPGESAQCSRCGEELWRAREDPLNRTLALTLAAAVLFIVANTVPMLGISVVGRATTTTVIGGVELLLDQGMISVAAVVFLTAVLAPGLQIACMLAIALEARRHRPRRWVAFLLRHYHYTQTWSMVEVMLLGVLVALVKITEYATVIPGAALFMLGALVVIFSAAQVTFDPREVWMAIEWADESQSHLDSAETQGSRP